MTVDSNSIILTNMCEQNKQTLYVKMSIITSTFKTFYTANENRMVLWSTKALCLWLIFFLQLNAVLISYNFRFLRNICSTVFRMKPDVKYYALVVLSYSSSVRKLHIFRLHIFTKLYVQSWNLFIRDIMHIKTNSIQYSIMRQLLSNQIIIH